MIKKILSSVLFGTLLLFSHFFSLWIYADGDPSPKKSLLFFGEKHLKNIKQLTFQGQNGEGYFSFDEKKIVFQSTRGNHPCDQIYVMDGTGKNIKCISLNQGRCTCAYFMKDGNILYSSTHLESSQCPPPPPREFGYVWPLYKGYDLFVASPEGKILKRLTQNPQYDAEGVLSPDGTQILFTSFRNGDIDIYLMKVDGTGVRRLTYQKGYDGGAFFSSDGKKVVFRAYHPKTEKEVAEYDFLLKKNLVRPRRLEIFVMDADGQNIRQVTSNGKANFAPFFHPSGKKILFCSNLSGRHSYELYLVNLDGTGLERITYSEGFNSFPMFSRNGKKLLFSSNRGAKGRVYNIFLCDWAD